MTKKDYELIAGAIRRTLTNGSQVESQTFRDGAKEVAFAIGTELAKDNSRFDKQRFLVACGLVPVAGQPGAWVR